jgi:hypothetical protein
VRLADFGGDIEGNVRSQDSAITRDQSIPPGTGGQPPAKRFLNSSHPVPHGTRSAEISRHILWIPRANDWADSGVQSVVSFPLVLLLV